MIRCDHIAVVVRSVVGVAWGLLEVGEFAEGWERMRAIMRPEVPWMMLAGMLAAAARP